MQLDWNANIRYGLYEDDNFTFLPNYKYKDVLWFSSFHEGRRQKERLITLIDIAIRLVKENARNERVLLQHIWTLRIGLLSYSKYLGQEDDFVINRIIKEFKADQYWLIWMTLIEMIVTDSHEWKYAVSKKIVAFYKRTSLKKGWANLIDELNKPGEQYALKCFERFLDEMLIRTN